MTIGCRCNGHAVSVCAMSYTAQSAPYSFNGLSKKPVHQKFSTMTLPHDKQAHHAQYSSALVLKFEAFVLECAAIDGFATCAISSSEVAALHDARVCERENLQSASSWLEIGGYNLGCQHISTAQTFYDLSWTPHDQLGN